MKQIIFLSIFILLFSCKKKESNNTNTTPEPPVSVTEPNAWGFMFTDFLYTDSAGTIKRDSTVQNNFGGAWTGYNVGALWLNDSLIPYNGYYMDTNSVRISGVLNYISSGSTYFAPFTYSYTASYPTYSGGALLPDTISKSSKNTFTVNGVMNSSSEFSLTILSGPVAYMKIANVTIDTFSVWPNDIYFLPNSTSLWLTLQLRKYKYDLINGKYFLFQNRLFYRKKVFIKP